ncbi:MAG: hypothetical protein FD188_3400 [Ignavibacteria bacterium]|nr:MAG: hypothetical protein FD188_3400 [Ignavibacteria bacterium]
MFNFSNFFLEKMNFSGKKMLLLLKLDSFPNTLNCFEK